MLPVWIAALALVVATWLAIRPVVRVWGWRGALSLMGLALLTLLPDRFACPRCRGYHAPLADGECCDPDCCCPKD